MQQATRWYALIGLLAASAAAGQETVTITSTDGMTRVTRQGEIVDFMGDELRLKTLAGREERIAASRVVEIQTTWKADHVEGRELKTAGKLTEAIAAFERASKRENRPWARRQVMAELTAAYAESGRFDRAGDEFLRIVAEDPATRHVVVMPLAWRSLPPDAVLEARASAWLDAGATQPMARILGASWLLSTNRRADAISALEQMALDRGADRGSRLAMLADVQLWRTKTVTANPSEVARWQSALEKMPPDIRACGYYVVGEALARLKQPEDAALAYLRVPLVHGEQRAMAADALVAAGKQLEMLGRNDQAAGLFREVTVDYASCPAAAEARTRLGTLARQP